MKRTDINYKESASCLNKEFKPFRNTFLTRSQIEDLVRESIPYKATSALITEMLRDGTLIKQHNQYHISADPIYYKRIQNWVENIRYRMSAYKANRKELKTVNCKSVTRFLNNFEKEQLIKFLNPILENYELTTLKN